jgi:hypothetical protein
MRINIKGKARANGNMTPATEVRSRTKTRRLPSSTTGEQAVTRRSPGRPIEANRAKAQPALRRSLRAQAPAVDRQAPRPCKAGGNRAPSVVWTRAVRQQRKAIAGRQAAKACPPHKPPREAEVVVPAAEVAAGAVVAAAAAAEEEDKEVRI